MKKLLLAGTILAAIGASPAYARLQLTVSDGTQTFSCFDGELGCDTSGGANNLSIVNPFIDGTIVQFTLTESTFGAHNELQLSSSGISASGAETITFVASDTSFIQPVTSVNNSASLTFNQNVGALDSTLKFWADPTNTQGANLTNTPGALLETVSGHATADPDSFAGSNNAAFLSSTPFSMTEGASLVLIAGGSITGYNQSMITSASVPEPSTWAMGLIGFGLLGLAGMGRRRIAAAY